VTLNQPTLLILEDVAKSRENLKQLFNVRGFNTFAAASTSEAHDLIVARPAEFDVLILDMILAESKTGADFGIEVREKLQESSPEFLIQSAERKRVDYYDLALKLGAAVYLDRNEPDEPGKLIQHTRALALRRGLRPTRPGLIQELRRISSESRNKAEANTRLCRELLVPHLRRTVGCGFVVLLSDDEGTRAFWSGNDTLQQDPLYESLQNGVFGDLRYPDPQLLDIKASPPLAMLDAKLSYFEAGQEEIPFLRLAEVEGVRLSLGLFDEKVPSSRLPESARQLAEILGRYMRPAVVNHLVEISQAFSDLESQKRGIAEASGTFCYYVGHEVMHLLDTAEQKMRTEGVAQDALLTLRALGEELKDSGELLDALARPVEVEMPEDDADVPHAGDLIRAAWHDLIGRGQINPFYQLEITGERAAVKRPDLFQAACLRILLWLTRRIVDYPPDHEPQIQVFVDNTPSMSIRFEDGSVRLPKQYRKRLFTPYSAPYLEPMTDRKDKGRRFGLFLTRALVEAQGGTFEDRSDDLPGEEIGHRLVVNLPRAR